MEEGSPPRKGLAAEEKDWGQEATMARGMGVAVLGGVVWLTFAAATAVAANWADDLFTEKAHDFGPVPRGGQFRHEFVLANRLGDTVTIVNVRASCGCTTGRAPTSQIAPGQSAIVEAQMDTRNFVGPKSTVLYVTVVTAAGREAEARLGISANILSDVVLNPGKVDFGTVARGQTPTQTLTIDRIGLATWKVERMVSASRVLSGQLVETARKDANVQYTLTLSLKPDSPPGVIRDEIRLMTNDPETAVIPIPVTAFIQGELVASPSLLALGKVTSAGGTQGRFLVRASKPFSIVSVDGSGDGFSVAPVDPGQAAAHIVTVFYRPEEGRTRGDLRRTFRVVTDLPGEPSLDLVASCHVEP
jgi:hypothetical protein